MSDVEEQGGPYSRGGFTPGPGERRPLRLGERVYWSDGTVSQVTDRGLERLPPDVEERLRAELHDLHVLDRAAAPDPEDFVATMRANGLHDPERG